MSDLDSYFSQFGINQYDPRYQGSNGLALMQQDALTNANQGLKTSYAGLPELTPTGAITQSPRGTYWTVPTADGLRYVRPAFNSYTTPDGSRFELNSDAKEWSVNQGEGDWTALGPNASSMRFSGSLPGMNWGTDNLTGYDVWNTAPSERYVPRGQETGWMQQFMEGPFIPLGAFLGAGAMGAGGMGNFLGSFGGEAAGGAVGFGGGAGGVSGGGMFDPFADFGSGYFDGASNFIGSDGVIPSSYGSSGWPSSGIYSGGPTSTNPFLPSTVNWNDGSKTVMNGLLGGGDVIKSIANLVGGGGNASLLSGLLGALAGGLGANQKPAGTVTSVQDIPDYLKGYQSLNLASGVQNFANAGQGAAMLPGAQAQLQKTINGDYLNPNSNPAFQPYVKDLMGQAASQFNSQYGQAPDNLNNSGFQEGYTRAITNAVLPLYNSAYQTERGNQLNAATNAPGFASNYAGAALAPNLAFKNLYTGAQATTNPYFSNPMGGALAGGMAGYTLGNSIFGGK